ncbi:MAG: sulfatase-like hydrolase/transferase [Bacteroidota bacterium]
MIRLTNACSRYAFGALFLAVFMRCSPADHRPLDPPNILWISAEDITTMLGTYGDENAQTPYLDAFAARSIRYDNAFATAPVCSPARSCLITGVHAVSLGSQHLRSDVQIPMSIVPFPKLLREVGYYCTNNDKEDYNFTDTTIWDESSKKAHWRNRTSGQPFFSVFNLGITHQSQVFGNDSVYDARIAPFVDEVTRTQPEELKLLPYYPDTPMIRKLWARYYTNLSIMDWQFAQILKELELDGLDENTLVFFFGDHGTGMPRSKRALYDSGLKVPLLVHVPERYHEWFNLQQPQTSDQLVSFADFAPTLLAIAGIEIPDYMQGRPFVSSDEVEQRDFVFGTSDRVDEAYELSRTVRSKEYRYIRNFYPHIPLLQRNFYTDQSAVMKELFRVRDSEPDNAATNYLFQPHRPLEELYLVSSDPHEMENLANDPAHLQALETHRDALSRRVLEFHDTGLMPEPLMLTHAQGSTPYEVARSEKLPLASIMEFINQAFDEITDDRLSTAVASDEPLVRYWAAVLAQTPNQEISSELVRPLLFDDVPLVRLEAAKYLVKKGDLTALPIITDELDAEDHSVLLFAARAYEEVSHLIPSAPVPVLEAYDRLKEQTAGRWQGQDLYAFWALREVIENRL